MEKRIARLVILLIMAMVVRVRGRDPELHRVGGGRFKWIPSVNFTQWASHQHFYVGDWLYFGFDKKQHSVLEVNRTGYERCIEREFITNVTRGGRDVFNLTEAKTYYFICGRGYCIDGMKVAVNVENAPPIPPPFPSPSESSSNIISNGLYACLLSFLIISLISVS